MVTQYEIAVARYLSARGLATVGVRVIVQTKQEQLAVKPVFLGLYSGDLRSAKQGIEMVERLKSCQKRWGSTSEAGKMAAGS